MPDSSRYLTEEAKAKEKKVMIIFGSVVALVILIFGVLVFLQSKNTTSIVAEEKLISGYVTYQNGMINRLPEDKKNILQFSTTWCIYCTQIEKDIKANQSKIPENMNILKVDMEKGDGIALAKKYKIQGPPMFVQVDAQQNEITQFQVLTLDDIIKSVK